jgi:hypothetical protein
MATKSTKAKKTAKKTTNGKSAKAKAPRENKTAKVVALLQRASGVTRPQALELTKWKGISFQVVAKNAGLKLKVDESKRPFVYRAEG